MYRTYVRGGDVSATIAGAALAELAADETSDLLDRRLRQHGEPDAGFVSTLRFRPFYVVGEVVNPGTYPYEPSLTVSDAVIAAGGFTYRASRTWIHIRRAGASNERMLRFDPKLAVEPGDTIRIGECRL